MENMNMGTGAPEEKKSAGAIISIVIIVLLLAFGAYYFLKQVPAGDLSNDGTSAAQSDQVAAAFSSQGNSTELDAIQKDLDSTDYSKIDAGLSGTTF